MSAPQIARLLHEIRRMHMEILGENLVGLYLHGSIAFGCFNPWKSDVDYIAVVQAPLAPDTRLRLLEAVYRLNRQAPPKGLEMSVVLQRYCRDFVYPTPFELHFSNMHRDAYARDPHGFADAMRGTDPDLAAHFTVLRHKGIALCGPPVSSVFGAVPWENYLDSICADIADAETAVQSDPIYVLLNLCRVLAAVREKRVLSKAEGGAWGLAHLDARFAPLLHKALEYYRTGGAFGPDNDFAADFCRYALAEIRSGFHASIEPERKSEWKTTRS